MAILLRLTFATTIPQAVILRPQLSIFLNADPKPWSYCSLTSLAHGLLAYSPFFRRRKSWKTTHTPLTKSAGGLGTTKLFRWISLARPVLQRALIEIGDVLFRHQTCS